MGDSDGLSGVRYDLGLFAASGEASSLLSGFSILPPLSLQTEVLAPFPWPVAGLAADRPPGPGSLSSRTSLPCLSPNSRDSLFHLAGWTTARLSL